MAIQTIDRGTSGDTGDKFKPGVAFDTCQANDDYLELNKVGTVATFAALASTSATVGQVVRTLCHTSAGKGGNLFQAYAGTVTSDNGTKSPSATTGVYWALVQNGDLTVEDFGVIGNSVRASTVDEYALLQNAITVVESRLFNTTLCFRNSYYKTSQTLIVTKPIHLKGARPQGNAYPGAVTATDGTELVWSGGADAMIFIGNVNAGGSVSNITLDGSNLAAYCIHADTIVNWDFTNVWCRHSTIYAFLLDARYGTCSWNTFNRLRCSNGYTIDAGAALSLAGYEGGYNVCHNTFINTTIEHASDSHGILLGFCDNNTFLDVYINRGAASYGGAPASSGYGVTYSVNVASWAYGNTFYHLQAGSGGYYEPAGMYGGVYQVAAIYGYSLDNTQPLPVRATYTAGGNTSTGTYVVFNSGDIWGSKTYGINTPDTARSYPLEVLTPATNSRGTSARLGQSHFLGSYDDQSFDLTGCHVNTTGTVIADNGAGAGTASGVRYNGSTITGYSFTGTTTLSPITLNAAVEAYSFVNNGSGAWTYGLCGTTGTARATGYGAPTGAAKLINFPGATATLAQTSGALADLLAELIAKGLIAA